MEDTGIPIDLNKVADLENDFSTVLICFTAQSYNKFLVKLEDVRIDNEELYNDIHKLMFIDAIFEYHLEPSSNIGSVLFTWDFIIWNRDFLDIDFIETTVKTFNTNEYLFLEVNENKVDFRQFGSLTNTPFKCCIKKEIYYEL